MPLMKMKFVNAYVLVFFPREVLLVILAFLSLLLTLASLRLFLFLTRTISPNLVLTSSVVVLSTHFPTTTCIIFFVFFVCQALLIPLYHMIGERETAKHATLEGGGKTKAKKTPADPETANPTGRIKLPAGQRTLQSELSRISSEAKHPMMCVNPKVVLMKADGDCFYHAVKYFYGKSISHWRKLAEQPKNEADQEAIRKVASSLKCRFRFFPVDLANFDSRIQYEKVTEIGVDKNGRCIDLLHWSINGKGYHFDVIQSKPNEKNKQTQEGKCEMIFSQSDQARDAGSDEKSKTAHLKSKHKNEASVGPKSGNSDGKHGSEHCLEEGSEKVGVDNGAENDSSKERDKGYFLVGKYEKDREDAQLKRTHAPASRITQVVDAAELANILGSFECSAESKVFKAFYKRVHDKNEHLKYYIVQKETQYSDCVSTSFFRRKPERKTFYPIWNKDVPELQHAQKASRRIMQRQRER